MKRNLLKEIAKDVSEEMLHSIDRIIIESILKKNTVVIYSGRFQPASIHHYKTYQYIENKFGKDNVFIATSNKVELPNSPLNFEEKKQIWKKFGVSDDKIVQVKNPYKATEITEKLNKDTIVIYVFGEKDAERLKGGKYFQPYNINKNLNGYEENSYYIVAPHIEIKVNGKELNGSLIRDLFSTKKMSKELFKKIYGWYDENIYNLLISKFSTLTEASCCHCFSDDGTTTSRARGYSTSGAFLTNTSYESKSKFLYKENLLKLLLEGGNTFKNNNSSVKKEFLDFTIKSILEKFNLESLQYEKLGNWRKSYTNDIDIGIDKKEICKLLKISPEVNKDELFKAIDEYLKNQGGVYNITKGLGLFNLQGSVVNEKNKPVLAIDNEGNVKIPSQISKIQIDVFIGNLSFMKNHLSGVVDSEYKAAHRNKFITSIFSKVFEDTDIANDVKTKYLINPTNGFYKTLVKIGEKGTRKEISRELLSSNMDDVAKFLFGNGITHNHIDTFEKVYSLFKTDKFKYPELRKEIVDEFRGIISRDKLKPVANLVEAKTFIKRFSGKNEMSSIEFLNFLSSIQPLIKNNKIDLSLSNEISISEKLDGVSCKMGANKDGKFFMESSNSGKVTIDNIEKFNSPYLKSFYEIFKYLNTPKFLSKINSTYQKYGEFTMVGELFPVLTHKADKDGNIIFVSVKYNIEKLGSKGCFVCFSSATSKGNVPEIIDNFEDVNNPEFKIYNLEKSGNLSKENLIFDFSELNSFISSKEKIENTIQYLKSNKDDKAQAIKQLLNKVQIKLQQQLNNYAEEVQSFLSKDKNKIEGVVLKIKLPNENIFLKGTSEQFKELHNKLSKTTNEISDLEKAIDGEFLVDVLGLSSANPSFLNKEIQNLKQSKNYDLSNESGANAFLNDLYVKIKKDNFDTTNIKENTKNKLKKFILDLKKIKSEWEIQKNDKDFDQNVINKTENFINFLSNKIVGIKNILDKNYDPDQYVIYLMSYLLKRRML